MRMKSESGLYTLDRARKRRQGPSSSDSNGQEMQVNYPLKAFKKTLMILIKTIYNCFHFFQKLNFKQQQPTNFYMSKEIEANTHHHQTKLPPV